MVLGVKSNTISAYLGSWLPNRVTTVLNVRAPSYDQGIVEKKKPRKTLWQRIKSKVIGFFSSVFKYLKSRKCIQKVANNIDYALHYREARKAANRNGAKTYQDLVRYHEDLSYEPGKSIDNKIYTSKLTYDGQSRPLVVLVLGKNQSLRGSRSNVGLLQVYDELKSHDDVDVMLFRVGGGLIDFGDSSGASANSSSDDSDCPFHSSVVLEHTANILEDTVKGKGKFAGYKAPSKIVFVGFSWGGGTVDQIVNNHRHRLGNAPISTAYVDAVRLGFGNLGCGVERRPECSSRHLHIHQENDLHGVHGLAMTNHEGSDVAIQLPDAYHKDIDDRDDVVGQISRFIEEEVR